MKKYVYNYDLMEYVPYKSAFPGLKYISIILLSGVMFFLGTMVPTPKCKIKSKISTTQGLPFSEENLKWAIEKYDILYPEIVLRQCKLETGNFTSELFLKGNNLCGMKVAEKRNQIRDGNIKIGDVVYAQYTNWEESLLDYSLWQTAYCCKITSNAQYYKYLDKYYATDPNYSKKLKNIEMVYEN